MSDRFDLSFKNKEVRMWFYIILPTIVVCSITFLFIDLDYNYIPHLLIYIAWIVYYSWRLFYRRNKKKSL